MGGFSKGRKICSIFVFITVFHLLFILSQSFAGSALLIDSDKQFGYAEELFSNDDFLTAVGEYKRFIRFFPNDERVEFAMFRIGMSYFKNRQYTKAINAFTAVIDTYRDTEISMQSYMMVSQCHLKLKAAAAAAISLHNAIVLTDDQDVKDEAFYRLGWIYLEMADWEKARLNFQKISMNNKHKYNLKILSDKLDRKDTIITKKRPGLAGFLSVIPGAGYFYCERYKDALIAFLANGILAYAAYESFDNDLDALGGIISLVELGFYAGNILGATVAAHKHNRMKTRQFIDHLKTNMEIDLSTGFQDKRVMLSLRYLF